MKHLLFAVCLLISAAATAQQKSLGSWQVVNGQYNVNKHWFLWGELQVRSQRFFNTFYYYETKGGAGLNIGKNFSFLAGTGRYATYSNNGNFKKPFANEEFRLWQQFVINSYLNKLKFEHRYRVEQRWLTNGGYKNRYRYRLNLFLPLNNNKIAVKTFFLNAHDEVFLTNREPHFERNRIFAGAGYMPEKNMTVLAGYMHQYDYIPGASTHKNFIQLSLLLQFHQQDGVERLPQVLD